MTIGVSLQRPDAAGENAYLAAVYDPTSPEYHQFLSVSQWQARFGVSETRYDAALAWLRGGGLTTTAVSGSTEYVLASGTARQVESLLGVSLNRYTYNSTAFVANDKPPTTPADLGVLDVSGLQDLSHMRTLQAIHAAAVASGKESAAADKAVIDSALAKVAGAKPNGAAKPSVVPNIGVTSPQDLWSIYDQPPENGGQGQSMAIFGWGCTVPADGAACASTDIVKDLRTDEDTYSLPKIPVTISHLGAPGEPINVTDGTDEWTLDLPAASGMAPDADSMHLYFGNNGQDPDILAAYDAWNRDATGPRQGSSSFAGCEASPLTGGLPGGPGDPSQGPAGAILGNPSQDAYEALLKETVGLGRTMFNSAGDLGANGCADDANTALNGVTSSNSGLNNYPSSSNYVTTVGGTVLYWNGDGDTGPTPATRALETSWTDTGGGTSGFISAPAWQTGTFETQPQSAPGVTFPCTVDSHATPYAAGTTCRGLPDVAAQSGDILTNSYFAGAGTSLSSPLWLGMWTRIQAASPNPAGLGFATPAIYANNADLTRYERDFFDIGGSAPTYAPGTVNDLTAPTCTTGGLASYNCSGSGWDYLSGWGTPNVTNLMKDLDDGNTTPTYVATANASLPEAPLDVMLPVAGLAMVALFGVAVRRRRRLR